MELWKCNLRNLYALSEPWKILLCEIWVINSIIHLIILVFIHYYYTRVMCMYIIIIVIYIHSYKELSFLECLRYSLCIKLNLLNAHSADAFIKK